ncbi:hypothetical protein RXV94_07570 [Yeosuana sp. MJ-SS3]|uniref:DUF5723 domain-containing protein n=1 Tax=Gilvirhabdus luticola TaxID=3079858 RepID=A0ABU3U6H8_9FLAO|nr:hypothetical protein [Yeosuana sp. MJ-SS3]MDU8886013.1 hypothetical protein [Yeosuana sp. MJ-SS3]
MYNKSVFVALIFLGYYGFTQQGNYKFNSYGNRSILLSGNVTGSVDDLGLTYYNPARLSEVENGLISFNAQAYELASVKLLNFNEDNGKLENTDFNGVPTMAGGIFNLLGTRFAYSYITKNRSNVNLNYKSNFINNDILEDFPDVTNYKNNLELFSKINEDWSGITWAYKVNDKMSLGISAFGSIYTYRSSTKINHTIESLENTVAYYENYIRFKQTSYGIFAKIGANYHFNKFDLGLNIQLPYLEIYEKGEFNYRDIIAGVGADYDQYHEYYFKSLDSKRKEPLSISLGAGIPIGKGQLLFNVDFVNKIKNYSRIDIPSIDIDEDDLVYVIFDEKRNSVINFGTGAEIYLTDNFKSYFGFSTDFNAYKSNTNIFDLSSDNAMDVNSGVDFYHFSTGIDWNLDWANIIFGVTYTQGSNELLIPSKLNIDGINPNISNPADLKYYRWQFMIGLEVPLLDQKVNTIFNKSNKND